MNPAIGSLRRHERGVSLIEMMVTLVIGAFLMIGVIAIFSQTRSTYRTNDAVERLQENLRFALATVQPDIRLARNWGMHSMDHKVQVPAGIVVTCPDGTDITAWALDTAAGVQASDAAYTLPCPAFEDNYRPGTDVLVVRHASGQQTVPTNGIVQVQSDRNRSILFDGGAPPASPACCTFDWQTHAYYIANSSSLGQNVPSLRRMTLIAGVLQDQEVIAGVEDLQVQLGVDRGPNPDNDVERYVDPSHGLVTVGHADFDANAKIIAVRFWLMLRSEQPEVGHVDAASYDYANVADYMPDDGIRRALVNKTIVLRNYLGYTGLP
ncbi:MAG: PilW family protein [Gammaproteobacteria bacterium]|nr:PilW family protein [Gammaproteobacteria bacterium]